MDGLIDQNID